VAPPTPILPQSLEGEYAGFVSRLIAFMVDIMIISSTIVIVTSLSGLILQFFGLNDILAAAQSKAESFGFALAYLLAAIAAISSTAFVVGYFIFFWVMTGQTPGKALMGLRIICLDGKHLSLTRAIRRYLAYWVSAVPFFFGFLWILLDEQRQGWHDEIAGTYVIYSWHARMDEKWLEELLRRMEGKS
jgi:uncharacterized RDD family membrane protein YckC